MKRQRTEKNEKMKKKKYYKYDYYVPWEKSVSSYSFFRLFIKLEN